MTKVLFFLLLVIVFASCNPGKESQRKDQEKADNDVQIPIVEDQKNSSFEALLEQYEDPGRVDWQNPDLVINKLGDLSDKVIADIGAGSGYFTFRLINQAAKVLAIDIEEQFLEFIDERKSGLNEEIASKVETRLVPPDNPSLEEDEVDVALIVNTYLNIDERTDYLSKLRRGLRQNGKLVIVDYKIGDIPTGPPDALKVSTEMAESELKQAGFKQINVDTVSLTYQYIIIAQ